jgi:hypothetical protein
MKLIGVLPAFLLILGLNAADDLSTDESKMLQDPAGWEYITVTDADNGIQTQHTCFDGQPHPEQCSGTLTLHTDNTFAMNIHIHGQSVARHGQYELNGREITFIDELGTSDGPYALDLDTQAKKMSLQIGQAAGVSVRADFELEKEYKKRLQNQKH